MTYPSIVLLTSMWVIGSRDNMWRRGSLGPGEVFRGSSTKLTLDFARLSLISLREGHYFKRISARVSPNAIQCLNIAGWSWKVSITWLTAPPVFLTSKRPIESGIRLHRITLALIWWSPTNRGSGRSRQNRASMAFLLPAWTSTQSLGKLNS